MICRRHPDNRDLVVIKGEHLPDCKTPTECYSCQPCDKRHCEVCDTHLDLTEIGTCVTCLGRTRRDLVWCLDLVALLPDHALNAGQHGHPVAGDPIPGGDAIVMLAAGSEGLADDGETNPGDPMPPAYLLAWWEERWRTELGHRYPADRRHGHPHRDLIRASAYLDANLGWAASHSHGFHTFAADLAGLRRYLEELLRAGDRPAEGVPCFSCNATLVRDYRDPRPCRHTLEAARTGQPVGTWLRTLATYPELGDEHADCDQGGLEGTDPTEGWHCPLCRRTYSPGEYGLALQAAHDEHADFRTSTDAVRLTGVGRGTITGWASKGFVRRRRDTSGRVTYSLTDIRLRRSVTHKEAG